MTLFFQYCQKLCVVSSDMKEVLLCQRKGEADYNEVYSLIGGKMEHGDSDIIAGITRERDEEVGADFKIKLLHTISVNAYFKKSDGARMILPHYLAIHTQGEITLSDEYSRFAWVKLTELEAFEPKIKNIPDILATLMRYSAAAMADDFTLI